MGKNKGMFSIFWGILISVISFMIFPNDSVCANELRTTAVSKESVDLYWDSVDDGAVYDVYYKIHEEDIYQLYGSTSETRINVNVEENKLYDFQIAPHYMVEESEVYGDALEASFDNSTFVDLKKQKYTFTDMTNDMRALCRKYSEYISYKAIGKTKKGRNIYDIILGNPNAEKTLLVVCELHAREYITSLICMKQIEYYLKNYNNEIDGAVIADTLNTINIHYVIMANPDGLVISQNRNSTWKGNANGVNINRNFPYRFKRGGSVRYNDYSGKRAGSEKETQAIINLISELENQKSLGVISYHAMGQIVFGSYRAKNKKLKAIIGEMYRVARDTTGYRDAGGYDSGTSSGCMREYLIYNLKIPCITIEVGYTSCPIEKKYYRSIYEKNRLVVLREARLF